MERSFSMARPPEAESLFAADQTPRAKALPASSTLPGRDEAQSSGDPPRWASPEFGALHEGDSRRIYYVALRFLGDPTQAEDATHDVFLKAYRKLGEFRGESAMRTWLYRITINHCRNVLQTWHQRNMVSNADDSLWETAVAAAESPLRVLEIKELGQRIQQTLDGLPPEYRLLLLLVADQQMSYKEIATLTEQSPDAVRGKLHRARKAFIAQFQKFT